MKRLISVILGVILVSSLVSSCSAKSADKESPAVATVEITQEAVNDEGEFNKNQQMEWPVKAVQVVVPYKAGGGVDSAARLLCSALEMETGQPFIITNKPEGNGIIGTNELAKAEPDGYSLMVISNRDIFGHIVSKIEGVDYQKNSFTYISSILEAADCLFTNTEKYPTFERLLEAVKEKPSQITVAVSNNTGLQTLEALNEALDVQFDGIVYNGGSEAFADLMGKHVDASLVALSFNAQALQNGCTPVVTMTKEKVLSVEGTPCVYDFGAGAAVSPMLRMFMGPAGMKPELVDAITGILDKLYAADGNLVARLNAEYNIPNYMTHEKLMEFVDENFAFREAQADGN